MQRHEHKNFIFILLLALLVTFPALILRAEEKSGDDYVCSQMEDAIYATLLKEGYSKAGACGILGNIAVENPDFNPDLYANNGTTYGLFQWNNDGERLSNLKKWCNNRILYPNRADGQIAFAIYELEGGDGIACRLNDFLKSTEDAALAAEEFTVGFERCVGTTDNSEDDGIYTGTIYPEYLGYPYQALKLREKKAEEYYEKYQNAEVEEDLAYSLNGVPTAGVVAEKEQAIEEKAAKILPVWEEAPTGVKWLFRIVFLFLGYLGGCLSGVSLLEGKLKRRDRERMKGKLPSLINLLRYVGPKEALLAAAIDLGKLYMALFLAYLMSMGALEEETILWVGFGVILGNDFPFWHRFKGGMGLLVTTAYICTYMPIWGFTCTFMGFLAGGILGSFPAGGILIAVFTVPYAFLCRDIEAGIFLLAALSLLLVRHESFLRQFFGVKFSRKKRRRKKLAASSQVHSEKKVRSV